MRRSTVPTLIVSGARASLEPTAYARIVLDLTGLGRLLHDLIRWLPEMP